MSARGSLVPVIAVSLLVACAGADDEAAPPIEAPTTTVAEEAAPETTDAEPSTTRKPKATTTTEREPETTEAATTVVETTAPETTAPETTVAIAAPPSTSAPETTAPPPPAEPPPDVAAPVVPATLALTGVAAQQHQLNILFYGRGVDGLDLDGDSGRKTEQLLCAARAALGLPVSRADMEAGSPEEQALMAATTLPIPPGAPTFASRWVLIDKTCQVMFLGEGDQRLVNVFPTSTGEGGFSTRDQDASRVFRYNPARGNGGWHNSYDYPVGEDNPLNGNMYKPVYFDGGQAIHGANNVPTYPASKGCARLRVAHQEALINWAGYADIDQAIYGDPDRLDLTVTARGDYW